MLAFREGIVLSTWRVIIEDLGGSEACIKGKERLRKAKKELGISSKGRGESKGQEVRIQSYNWD